MGFEIRLHSITYRERPAGFTMTPPRQVCMGYSGIMKGADVKCRTCCTVRTVIYRCFALSRVLDPTGDETRAARFSFSTGGEKFCRGEPSIARAPLLRWSHRPGSEEPRFHRPEPSATAGSATASSVRPVGSDRRPVRQHSGLVHSVGRMRGASGLAFRGDPAAARDALVSDVGYMRFRRWSFAVPAL